MERTFSAEAFVDSGYCFDCVRVITHLTTMDPSVLTLLVPKCRI